MGDSSSFERALGKASGSTSRFGGVMGKAKLAGLGLAGVVAIGSSVLKKSVDAAKEAELSQRKMEAQLKASGIAYDRHKDKIAETIAAHSRLSAFDDEDLQDSFTNLVRTTGDVNEALRLNALAADLARGKNISLEAASKAIGKVAAGNTSALGRLGIQLEKGTSATEALGIVQQKFKGQAEAYGDSAAGAQEKFGVALENLQESIGKHVLPVLTKLMVKASEAIVWLEVNWPRIQEVIDETMAKIRPIVEPVLRWITNAFKLVAAIIRGDWSAAWDALKEMVAGALTAMKEIIRLELELLWKAMKALGEKALDGITTGLGNLGEWITGKLDDIKNAITGKLNDVLNWGKSVGTKIKEGAVAGVTGIASAVWNVVNNIGATITDKIGDILDWGRDVGSKVKSGAVAGVTGIAGDVWGIVKNIGSTIAEKTADITAWGKGLAGDLLSGIKSGLAGLGGWLVEQLKNAVNSVIRRVNSLFEFSFDVDTKIPGLGKVGVRFDAPDIPELHSGGVFRAPRPGGEGLALLKDRETVLPPGQQALGPIELHFHSIIPTTVEQARTAAEIVVDGLRGQGYRGSFRVEPGI